MLLVKGHAVDDLAIGSPDEVLCEMRAVVNVH